MYWLIMPLFIFGVTSSSTTNLSFMTYDCWDMKKKDLISEIWSSTFADNLRSLTIQNCDHLVLNISTVEGIKSSLRYLTVRNVRNCEIIGSECSGTSLPSHTNFIDVGHMKVEVPLYGESKLTEGILEFTNVTIERLKSGCVSTPASLKKFSMRQVAVMIAERDAITFEGNFGSLLEITDSTFHTVDENFIFCNVTSTTFQNNLFKVVKAGSFSLETTSFNFLGNIGNMVEDCAVRLYSQQKQIEDESCSCKENDLFNGKICVSATPENSEETIFKTKKNYFDEDSKKTTLKTQIQIMNFNNSDDCGTAIGQIEKGEKFPIFVNRFGNRLLLLWFLAISLLVLMFPIAYFTKIFLCKIINRAFPLDIKHKLLINAEDI